MSDCIGIGKPSDFGGNGSEMFVLSNWSPDGIEDIIDTCDIDEAFGHTGIADETIALLFMDDGKKLLPKSDLQKRVSFFKEYPKLKDLDEKMKKDYKPEDPKTFTDIMEWYYSKTTAAHKTYGVPFISEEQGLISKLLDLLIYRGEDAFAGELIKWLCASPSFPDIFFIEEAKALVDDHWDTGLIDQTTGEIKPNDFLNGCITAAPESRKKAILYMIDKKVEAFKNKTAPAGQPLSP